MDVRSADPRVRDLAFDRETSRSRTVRSFPKQAAFRSRQTIRSVCLRSFDRKLSEESDDSPSL